MTNLQIINNKSKFQSHSYHLVDQSPWPFLISWSLFFSAIGAVLSIHGFYNGELLLSLGLLLTLSIMYFWLGDVNTGAGKKGWKMSTTKCAMGAR